MNRFFEFSNGQIRTLILLSVIVVLVGSYKFISNYYMPSQDRQQVWKMELLESYQPTMVINLNTTPQDSLELVPGIGPVYSRRIIEYRARNGNFPIVDSLLQVRGIGPQLLAKIRKYFKVDKP